jgi:hypothetical protein
VLHLDLEEQMRANHTADYRGAERCRYTGKNDV